MMKLLKKLLCVLVVSFILCCAVLGFLLFTTPGLYTSIRLATLFVPGSLQVIHLDGRLYDKFSIAELHYQNQQTQVGIKELKVNWHLSQLLHPHLLVTSLAATSITITQNQSTHTIDLLFLNGDFSKQLLNINSFTFSYLGQDIAGHIQLLPVVPNTIAGTITINKDSNLLKVLRGTVNISGDRNRFQCNGHLNGLGDIAIDGDLQHLELLNLIVKWRNLTWSSSTSLLGSPEGSLRVWGTLPKVNGELTSKVNKDQQENWQIHGAINGTIPWQWNFTTQVFQPLTTSKKEGLHTSFIAKGRLEDQSHGRLSITINPGHYQMPEHSLVSSLDFKGGVIDAILTPKQLTVTGSLVFDPNKKLDLKFNLPRFDLAKGLLPEQQFNANLSLSFNSFDFLKHVSSDIKNPQGHLVLALQSQGTIAKPIIESSLNLDKASVTLPKLGLDLNNIELRASAKNNAWEAIGALRSSGKQLNINAKGPLSPKPKGEIIVNGDDFPIINSKEYQINLSPQLKLNIDATSLHISGTLLVPYAQIRPHTFSNSVTLSDDVVFKSTTKEVPSSFNSTMDVTVVMGEQVELTFKGLHALLVGDVHIKQLAQGAMNATGELNVKKGEYKAYGQDLAIEQGELVFTGGRIDNPGINLRASKNINTSSSQPTSSNQVFDFNNTNLQDANIRGNITVGVEVTGQISSPKIQLFSNPSILSQADILSMLVLGRPANQANKAGGQLLLAAISSMNLGGGTSGAQLLEQLKNTLGFDFNVQTNTNYNIQTNQVSDTTGFVVGKSLSKRIYLSYNVGLSQTDPNVLTLKYLLNKFFSIQVSSSDTGNGIDFLYTSTSKDKVHE